MCNYIYIYIITDPKFSKKVLGLRRLRFAARGGGSPPSEGDGGGSPPSEGDMLLSQKHKIRCSIIINIFIINFRKEIV